MSDTPDKTTGVLTKTQDSKSKDTGKTKEAAEKNLSQGNIATDASPPSAPPVDNAQIPTPWPEGSGKISSPVKMLNVRPLRTLESDISHAFAEQNISYEKGVASLSRKLREELKKYSQAGGDKEIKDIIKSDGEPVAETPVQIKARGIGHVDIEKARERTKALSGMIKPRPAIDEEKHDDIVAEGDASDFIIQPEKTISEEEAAKTPLKKPSKTIIQELPAKKEAGGAVVIKEAQIIEGPEKPRVKSLSEQVLRQRKEEESVRSAEAIKAQKETVLNQEFNKLERELTRLESEFARLPVDRAQFEKKLAILKMTREEKEVSLATVLDEEMEAEARQKEIEKKEKTNQKPEDERAIEKQRWGIEDERKNIEKKRWGIDQDIIKIEKDMEEISLELNTYKTKEERLSKNIQLVKNQIAKLKREKTKIIMAPRLAQISKEKESLEMDWVYLNDTRTKITNKLKPLLSNEEEIEGRRKLIEEAEHKAVLPEDVHKYEVARWQLEEEKRQVETQRWKIDEEVTKIAPGIEVLKTKYRALLTEEQSIFDKMSDVSP